MENLLLDMDCGGQRRKLLVHPGRTGFVDVLDRETGELLSAWQQRPDRRKGQRPLSLAPDRASHLWTDFASIYLQSA
jgi:glucose dehydrogenase